MSAVREQMKENKTTKEKQSNTTENKNKIRLRNSQDWGMLKTNFFVVDRSLDI